VYTITVVQTFTKLNDSVKEYGGSDEIRRYVVKNQQLTKAVNSTTFDFRDVMQT